MLAQAAEQRYTEFTTGEQQSWANYLPLELPANAEATLAEFFDFYRTPQHRHSERHNLGTDQMGRLLRFCWRSPPVPAGADSFSKPKPLAYSFSDVTLETPPHDIRKSLKRKGYLLTKTRQVGSPGYWRNRGQLRRRRRRRGHHGPGPQALRRQRHGSRHAAPRRWTWWFYASPARLPQSIF